MLRQGGWINNASCPEAIEVALINYTTRVDNIKTSFFSPPPGCVQLHFDCHVTSERIVLLVDVLLENLL